MEKRVELKDTAGYFWLDLVNSKFKFTGIPSESGIVYMTFFYDPVDLTESDSPPFNPKFHLLPAYRMAERFFPADGGERSRSWHDYYQDIADGMESDMELFYNELEEEDKIYEQ
jgi:hypothetical protein